MENNNQISDLRNAMFEQLNRLKDPNANLDKEVMRAEAMVNVGRVIVDSAKAEVDFMKVTGTIGTGFIPVTDTVKTLQAGTDNQQSAKLLTDGKS